jgi:hypothetical protein
MAWTHRMNESPNPKGKRGIRDATEPFFTVRMKKKRPPGPRRDHGWLEMVLGSVKVERSGLSWKNAERLFGRSVKQKIEERFKITWDCHR